LKKNCKKAARHVIKKKFVTRLKISGACQFLGITRQTWHQYWARVAQVNERHQQVLSFVIQERALQPRLGVRKLHHLMNQVGVDYVPGRDKLFALLREHRLLVPVKRAISPRKAIIGVG